MRCVFCEIVAGKAPASVIYADDRVTAFMGIQPSNPGECMVIPHSHIDHFTDVPDDLAAHIMVVAQKIGRKMKQVFSPTRVGFVVHGYGVPHAHLVIVPQHRSDDITSGRYARESGGRIVFDRTGIPMVNRKQLDQQAAALRIEKEPNESPRPTPSAGG